MPAERIPTSSSHRVGRRRPLIVLVVLALLGAIGLASAPFAVAAVPTAPTITSVYSTASQRLTITFTAPATPNGTITSYQYCTYTSPSTSCSTWRSAGSLTSPVTISRQSSGSRLVNGITYNVALRAVNSSGSGTASNVVTGIPGVPTAPAITSITPSSARLTVAFTPPSSNAGSTITLYEYSTDAGVTWKARTDGGTTSSPIAITLTSSTNVALVNGTQYSVRIRARNSRGAGVASPTVTATPATVPGAPTLVSGSSGNASSLVSWTAPASNGGGVITGYKVEYAASPYSSWTVFTANTGTTAISATVTGLANGTYYEFRVSAVNAQGTGSASTASAAVQMGLPGQPNLQSATPSSNQLSLTFSAPSSNGGSAITSYQYSTDGGSTWRTRTDSPTSLASPMVLTVTSGAGTTLQNNTTYNVQIRAVNSVNPGAASLTIAAAPVNTATTPGAPVITTITPSNVQLSVAFTPGSNGGSAITSYQYSTDAGVTWKTRTDSAGSTDSPIVITEVSGSSSTLANGTRYDVKIRAVNGVGAGTGSTTVPGTPATVPGAPTSITGIGSNTAVLLSWSAPGSTGGSPITAYAIDFSDNGGSTWTVFDTDTGSTATSGSVTSLSNGTAYVFRVAALNAQGQSAWSTTSSPVTPFTFPGAPTINSIAPAPLQLSVVFGTPPTDNGGSAITEYEYSTDNGVTWAPRDDGSLTTSPLVITRTSDVEATNRALVNGTTYQVVIQALNAAGAGTDSNMVTGTPQASVPSAPAISGVTPADRQLLVRYSVPVSDGGSPVTSYKYSTDDGITWKSATFDAAPLTLNITQTSAAGTSPLVNGVTYDLRILAVNSAGDGTPSAMVPATPATAPGAPTAVDGIAGDAHVDLTWTAPASNGGDTVIAYRIEVSESPYTTWTTQVDTTGSPATSYRVAGLANGTTYKLRVSAENHAGWGAPSDPSHSVVVGAPHSPVLLTGTPGDATATLVFSPPTNPGGSAINDYKYSTDGGVTWRARTDSPGSTTSPMIVTVTSGTAEALVNGTPYTMLVRAVNSYADGEPSNSIVITPQTSNVVPGAPTITGIEPADQALTVNFTAGSDGGAAITSYKYSTDGSTWKTASGTTSPLTLTEQSGSAARLSNGTSYSVRILAVNSVGDGAASAAVIGTPATFPGKPTGLSGIASDDAVLLSWTAPAETGGAPITGYRVDYRLQAASEWTTFDANTGTTDTEILVAPLLDGQQYMFQVFAINAAGLSPASDPAGPYQPHSAPPAPVIDSITAGDASARVTYHVEQEEDGDATNMDFRFKTFVSNTWTEWTPWTAMVPAAPPAPAVPPSEDGYGTMVVPGLPNGVATIVQIRAMNQWGDGLPSLDSAQVTPTQYSPRVSTAALSGASGDLLSWSGVQGEWATPIDFYNVVYRVAGSSTAWGAFARGSQGTITQLDSPEKGVCSTANTAYGWVQCPVPMGWTSGVAYEFSVFAVGTNGVNPLSNRVPLVPLVDGQGAKITFTPAARSQGAMSVDAFNAVDPTPTPTDTATPTPTDVPAPTDTATPTDMPAPTDAATPTPTETATPTPTDTAVPASPQNPAA